MTKRKKKDTQDDYSYLTTCMNYPVIMFTAKEMAYLLRVSEPHFRHFYSGKIVEPVKSGPSKYARSYYSLQDVYRCIDHRFGFGMTRSEKKRLLGRLVRTSERR